MRYGEPLKAAVGDRLVIDRSSSGGPRRVGLIVGVRHADGSPPYTVRWLDQERETLVFPGPDAHIEHRQAHAA